MLSCHFQILSNCAPVNGALRRGVGSGLDARLRRRLSKHRQPVRVAARLARVRSQPRPGCWLGGHQRRRLLACFGARNRRVIASPNLSLPVLCRHVLAQGWIEITFLGSVNVSFLCTCSRQKNAIIVLSHNLEMLF